MSGRVKDIQPSTGRFDLGSALERQNSNCLSEIFEQVAEEEYKEVGKYVRDTGGGIDATVDRLAGLSLLVDSSGQVPKGISQIEKEILEKFKNLPIKNQ